MKKLFLPALLLAFISSFSQNIEKKELEKKEVEYLAKSITTMMFEPKSEDYENSIKNNLVNYGFEILYNDEVIYRGAIKKPSLSDINSDMHRNNAAFCFEYNMFDSETKLELAENRKIKIGKTKDGKKILLDRRL
ncbi:MAG: hypothetical protein ACK5IQ_01110 [Bacteroidales bacterium]